MKILLVSSFLPYPLFSGGYIRLYNIIRELSLNHEISLVCEKRDYQTKEDIKEVEKFCEKVIAVDRKKQWSFSNIIKTCFSIDPFLVVGHTNEGLKQTIVQLLNNEQFDLIHIETFYVYQNIPKTQLPIVLVEHNIEHLVYKRFADKAPAFLRPLLYLDVAKLKRYEQSVWKKATRIVAVSEQEKKLMKRRDAVVVPNGVNINKFKVQSSKFKVTKGEKRILFIGDFRWIQNKDAVEWILTAIWPIVHPDKVGTKFKVHSSIKLWIVGREIPDSIKKLSNGTNVIFDENAPSDTTKIYQKADVLLAPLRVAGGTSFKILEAMASGVPVISTKLGNEGIGARDQEEVLLADDVDGIAHQISNALNNQDLRKKIVKNARKFIEERYDWETIVKRLEDVYESVL